MATDGRYLTVDAFKRWTRDETIVDDDLISESLLAAQGAIDRDLGRRFEVASGSTSARLYVPEDGDTILYIHDAVSITSIVEDGTTVATADWQAEPLNNLAESGDTVPYTHVVRLSGTWYADNGKATVSVTADWGWQAIPPDVVELCKVVTQTMAQMRNLQFGLAAVAEGVGGVSPRNARLVRDVMERYSRRKFMFAA